MSVSTAKTIARVLIGVSGVFTVYKHAVTDTSVPGAAIDAAVFYTFWKATS